MLHVIVLSLLMSWLALALALVHMLYTLRKHEHDVRTTFRYSLRGIQHRYMEALDPTSRCQPPVITRVDLENGYVKKLYRSAL